MSIHRSLATKGGLVRSRNVLTRFERILELRRTGKWKDESSPYGLPKVRVVRVKKRAKKKEKVEGAAAAATPGAAPAAAPAAAAAPTKGGGKKG